MANSNVKLKKVTINDVAKAAGVSKTTISRYINGKYDYMSLETQNKIQDVIKDLNYRPNRTAQSLKSGKTKIIGCVIADITNDFSQHLVKGINDVCVENNYQVFFVNTDNNPSHEKNNILSLLDNKLDGIIVNTTGGNDDFLISIHESRVPVVMADRQLSNEQVLNIVTSTNYDASYECVEHLHSQGYDAVYFISREIGNNRNREIRHQAFIDATSKLYGAYDSNLTYFISEKDQNQSLSQLKIFLKSIIEEKGSMNVCFFCVNGTVLLDVIKVIQYLGFHLGGDIGICGFDDWEWASLIPPGITTIRQDTYQIGRKTAELLIEQIENTNSSEQFVPEILEMPTELIIRGSTKI